MNSSTGDLEQSSRNVYDVLIVGGGVVGTGIARDAALRGMSVVLFERDDLSCGTTSRSSRLIHGGLRYLDTYDFGLVFKDLREREQLLHLAPHLVRPLKFVVPNYDRSSYQRFRLRLGMVLYDLFSTGKSIPTHKMLPATQVTELEPSLKKAGLQGGALFYDCQAPFVERISIENSLSANEKGAKIFNHVLVVNAKKGASGRYSVLVEDVLSGKRFTFGSRVIVNAGGPWADDVLKVLSSDENKKERKLLRTTKGVHIAVPKLGDSAMILYAKSDNRLFFVIPWFGYSLIGTTDTDYFGDPENVEANDDDIDYLIRESSQFVESVSKDRIQFVYAGVRPLVRSSAEEKESEVSRNYKIVDHSARGMDGVISVLGVKITSFRIASKDATDLLSKKLRFRTKCLTDREPLPGARGISNFDEFARINVQKLKKYGLEESQILHLSEIYGTRVENLISIIETDPRYTERICPNNPDIVAQIVLAVREEFAASVSDFQLRRAPIAFRPCRGLDCADRVAAEMGALLGWSKEEIDSQIKEYERSLEEQIPLVNLTTRTSRD